MKTTQLLKYIGCALSLILVISCQSIENKLSKSWTPIELPDDIFYSGRMDIINLTGDQLNKMMTPISFLDFHSNGNYSSYFYKYNHGTWEKKDDYLLLKQNTGKIDTILFKSLSNDTLTLGFKEEDSYKYFKFVGFENSKDPKENPFLIENNKWRIQATKNENNDQIKSRILNHLTYYKLYFQLAVDKKIFKIDAKTLPSPIEITQYGVRPNPESSFNNWRFYFHSEVNFNASKVLIEKHLNSTTYPIGNGSGDKQLFDLFSRLEEGFRNDSSKL
ncbi:hypothetical protein EGI26_14685 [Lacihabitans sp. CCS-44]|uniref:lipocalin family protein n=1 Tax=Lacihabitans sp. CCS-44 TaxID=2487331 RepID=UPI0020CD14AA|nr:lipocalin family protein [Lacihabitans sp. CCS-44]MCP9756408.1 hypothetical protein [Lacihabitans sp. CCS-44]